MSSEAAVLAISGAFAPAHRSYRYDGADWVLTHPPAVDERRLAPREDWRFLSPEVLVSNDGATKVNDLGSTNKYQAWELTTSQSVVGSAVDIPSWWGSFAVVLLFARIDSNTGNVSFTLRRQYSFYGDSTQGTSTRNTTATQTYDVAEQTSLRINEKVLEDGIVVPARRPDCLLPHAHWQFLLSRITTGNTYASAIAVYGLAIVRRS